MPEVSVRPMTQPEFDELNVFGDNATAIGLYTAAGYRVVSQQMRKRLADA